MASLLVERRWLGFVKKSRKGQVFEEILGEKLKNEGSKYRWWSANKKLKWSGIKNGIKSKIEPLNVQQ